MKNNKKTLFATSYLQRIRTVPLLFIYQDFRSRLPGFDGFNRVRIMRVEISEPLRKSRNCLGVIFDHRSRLQLTELSRT